MVFKLTALLAVLVSPVLGASTSRHSLFVADSRPFLQPPDGSATTGDSHGDIAVSPAGDIYVSVQGGEHPGLQVYDSRGRYLRNVPQAPPDLHGFVITRSADGIPRIYGASLEREQIVQLSLDGELLLTIPAVSIPDRYKTLRNGEFRLALTGVAVAPSGDIYAVDGYGRDFIHRFDRSGQYIGSFGGRDEPWGFNQCHKLALDPRFEPARLLCTDRVHNRLVHMDLNGRVLGVFAHGLRFPSALAFFRDEVAVAELDGRVTILGLRGEVRASLGTNENPAEIRTNNVPPEKWLPGLFYAPHGVIYDAEGDLLVTEWSKWGRVVRWNRVDSQTSRTPSRQ